MIDRIRHSRDMFKSLTGRSPTCIYVGDEEHKKLGEEWFLNQSPHVPGERRDQIFGMRVYRVNSKSHFHLA